MFQSTSIVGTSAWCIPSGDVSLACLLVAIWPGCWLAFHSAAAPNPYWDSRGQTHGVWRLTGMFPVGPMLLCSHTSGHSRRLAHPSRMSRFWQLGVWGRRRDLVPGSQRGGGPSERDTQVSQLFEWPAMPCTLLGPSTDASPLDVTPVHSRCRLFTQLLTSVLLLRGCLWSSAF